jgi:hypothetical protein
MTEVLRPQQWDRLMARLAALPNPRVATHPSRYALAAQVTRRTH